MIKWIRTSRLSIKNSLSLCRGWRACISASDPTPYSRQVFFFFITLVTGPRRSLSLKLSDTSVYEPQIRARLRTTPSYSRQARPITYSKFASEVSFVLQSYSYQCLKASMLLHQNASSLKRTLNMQPTRVGWLAVTFSLFITSALVRSHEERRCFILGRTQSPISPSIL